MTGHARAMSLPSRLELLLLAGLVALAFLAGAAKASAAGSGDATVTSGGTTFNVPSGDDGGVSHIDPYGKG
jgi:hypothetical protein